MSSITGYSAKLVEIAVRGQALDGVPIFGDAANLPAKFIDGLEVIAIERSRVNATLAEAKAIQTDTHVQES